MRKKKLGEILRERNHLSEAALERALNEQKNKLAMLGEVLLEGGKVSKQDLTLALEEVSRSQYLDLAITPVDPELLRKVPRTIALGYCVLPVFKEGKKIKVAMAQPQDLRVVDELRFRLGAEIEPCFAFQSEIHAAIEKYYPENKKTPQEVEFAEQVDPNYIEFFTAVASERNEEAIKEFQRELRSKLTPAVHLVSAILRAAAAKNASDVHIEQEATGTLVRLRVDGVLRDLTQVPAELRTSLISRIKILCDMDIAERRVPQDGRLLARIGETQYDLRVSTLPTQFGEKITIRLLDPTSARVSLRELGLAPDHCDELSEILSLPQGMVLVTGPTGSGKTTTLYAALHLLRSPGVSILTIEDPVEYMMRGINQVQVNARAGRTFANCLRSMLRQDPNIIMVGEIRDRETAEIAMEVSQTGHLILTTLHTNDSVGAITRLLDLNITAFLLTSSVTAIIAQRLVRRLCHCRREEPISAKEATLLTEAGVADVPESVFRAVGCDACDESGYRGRIGVFELLVLDDEVREVICSGGRDDQIRSLVRANGMKSMQADALEKVRLGVTTVEEVTRVVPFEDLGASERCAGCQKHLSPKFVLCPYCGTRAVRKTVRKISARRKLMTVGAGTHDLSAPYEASPPKPKTGMLT
ncbi:MAG TPA: ATPase, T2SS/T4P/T4SS family [Terriglobales bacterium]|nr:ATPase, T2SS/T4P/T4SS family [Terriglobales bacterium]